ncbi:MAG: hypothetical protein LBJ64_00400, partial [Deltaproteobacteria bacterium]|nr:hypothetical protein [Deltaproteobacteria bacterium]
MPFDDQPVSAENRTEAGFFDIFKHSWPILWEKPKELFLTLLLITGISVAFKLVADYQLRIFDPVLDQLLTKKITFDEAARQVVELLNVIGYMPVFTSFGLPWLLTPFVNFSLCQMGLNIWDGYENSPRDLNNSICSYPRALWSYFLWFAGGLVLLLLTSLSFTPMFLAQSFVRGAETTAAGGGNMFFLSALGFLLSAGIFIKLVWPLFRKFVFLQYFLYFSLVEGYKGSTIARMKSLYEQLRAHPHQLNVGLAMVIGYSASVFIFVSIIVGIMYFMLPSQTAIGFVQQFLFLLTKIVVLLTLAGFYRL